jgi:hypothetical protein
MANKTGKRMASMQTYQKSTIQLYPTQDLINELRRRSLACLLVTTVLDDGNETIDIAEAKGSPVMFQASILRAQGAINNHLAKLLPPQI